MKKTIIFACVAVVTAAGVLLSCSQPSGSSDTPVPTLSLLKGSVATAAGGTINLTSAPADTTGGTATTLTLKNTGSATLVVTGAALTGTNKTLYSLSATTFSIAAGATANFAVTVSPGASDLGYLVADLTFTSNTGGAAGTTTKYTLRTLSYDATSVPSLIADFNSVVLSSGGTTTLSEACIYRTSTSVITLTNAGGIPLVVSSVAFSETNAGLFSSDTSTATLAAGESADITITFAPETLTMGIKTALLTITSNSSGTAGTTFTQTVSAEANGAPDPATPPDDWASYSSSYLSSPGGYGATTANTYRVTTRAEFVSALKCGGSSISDTKKIIYIDGMIDLADGMDGADYLSDAGYSSYGSWEAWRTAYVATCTKDADGSGTPETARAKAYALEKAQVVISIGSNTSILGIGSSSGFKNGSFSLSGKKNVVIRNVAILDAFDWFGYWDASDTNVNTELDGVSINNGSTYVWIDHCTLGDGERPDSLCDYVTIPGSGEEEWVTHDGLVDVVNGSNYVTLSWNIIKDHNKTMLFGNSDSTTSDSGYIKVTLHHNYFTGVTQRLPRVRYGQVHVYNNYYESIGSYSIGVGKSAQIYSENNVFASTGTSISIMSSTNGGVVYDTGSSNVDSSKTGASTWIPSSMYTYTADSTATVTSTVPSGAGIGQF